MLWEEYAELYSGIIELTQDPSHDLALKFRLLLVMVFFPGLLLNATGQFSYNRTGTKLYEALIAAVREHTV